MPLYRSPARLSPSPSSPLPASWAWPTGRWRSGSARRSTPDSGGAPPNTLFVPDFVRSEVLQWGHAFQAGVSPRAEPHATSPVATFPVAVQGLQRQSLRHRLSCVRGKSSHQPPAGLLNPLPILWWPWSHNAVDFIAELPPSRGHRVILTIVDRFSKAARFVLLPKLPLANVCALKLCFLQRALATQLQAGDAHLLPISG